MLRSSVQDARRDLWAVIDLGSYVIGSIVYLGSKINKMGI